MNFLEHIISMPEAQAVLEKLQSEHDRECFEKVLQEAHTWGYFSDFPELENLEDSKVG